MKTLSRAFWMAAGLYGAAHGFAPAATVTFDDLPVFAVPGEQYSQLGVHFGTSGYSYPPRVEPGLAGGDPNHWGFDGTAGPSFLGNPYGYGLSLEFDTPISSFSLDAARPAVIGDTTFTIYGYYRGNYLGAQAVNLRSGGPWTNVFFNHTEIDRIDWYIGGGGRYAIDNIQFTLAPGTGAPLIYASPSDRTAYIGTEVALSVRASGQQPFRFQWYFEGAALSGRTNSTLWFPAVQTNNAGHYYVTVSNALGGAISYTNTLTLVPGTPVFTAEPYDNTFYAGGYAALYSYASGFPTPQYQWQFYGTNIPGATNNSLLFSTVQTDQSGPYQVIAYNASGSTTSRVAILTVLTEAPEFYRQPASQTVSEGSHVQFRAGAWGAPYPTFQWNSNGVPIPGETKDRLKLHNVTSNNAAVYSVSAMNAAGVVLSTGAVLAVVGANTLDAWEWRNPSPQGNELSGIVYGNSRYVSVGRFGAIVTSEDGTNWTPRTGYTQNHLYSVAYGAGRFVAVGSAGEILTSSDGTGWQRQNSGTAHNLYSVTYDDAQFVAVGHFGTVLTSTDGLAWTARTSGSSNHLRGIVHGGGKYVAVGSSGEILSSPDAVAWTRAISPETRNLRSVAYGNGAFVTVGNQGAILRSTNGVDWSAVYYYTYVDLRSVAFVNGTFISVGRYGYVYTSTDGLAWIYNYTPQYDGLYDVAKGTDNYVAVGDRGALLFATNTMQWLNARGGRDMYFADAAYGNGRFIAVGSSPDGSNLWSSSDARNWQLTNVAPGITLNAALYAAGKFVIGGNDSSSGLNRHLWTSSNAIDWTPHTIDVGQVQDIAYGNGTFIVVGGSSYYLNGVGYIYSHNVAFSSDGENWTSGLVQSNNYFYHVAAGNGTFLALTYYTLFASTNRVDWTQVSALEYSYLYSITYGNGLFVGAGYSYDPTNDVSGYTIFTSSNGFAWQQQPLPGNRYVFGTSFVNGWFVLTGEKGFMLASRDGRNWVERNSMSEAWLQAVAYGQHAYVAVGSFGAILRAGELAFEPPASAFNGGNFELVFNGEPGRTYRLQYSTDLQQWFHLGSVTNTQPRMTFRDPGASSHPRRFYRLVTP